MSISQEERDELQRLVRGALGERGADLLMAGLDPAVEDRLGQRIDALRLELQADMAGMRGEFGELRGEFGELRGEFAGLEGRVRGEIGGLRGEIGALRAEMAHQTRSTFLAVFTANGVVAGLVWAAVQLAS